MPYLFNENTRAGVPIAYQFAYGGNSVDWGSTRLMSMGDVSVRAEPLDGKFSVSELKTTFADTDGSLWGSFGHGTTCLGSSWSATVYIGGTMEFSSYGAGETRLTRLNTQGAGTYVIHKGRITDIQRSRRTVTLTSRSLMAQVADLEWRFPVHEDPYIYSNRYGSNFFFNTNLITTYGTCFFNYEEDNKKFQAYVFVGSNIPGSVDAAYPTPAGRGTMGRANDCLYPGTQFYLDFDRYFFEGTYLGTYSGTINSLEDAWRYGFSTVEAAESAKVSSVYPIGKTRLTLKVEGEPEFTKGSYFVYQQSALSLGESPAILWREMLTGCCVTPLFGSSTDIDADSYGTAATITAFQYWERQIDPKGGKVLPYIKNLMEPLHALFSVNPQNKLRLHCYGPRNLNEVIGTIAGTEIIESDVSSSIEDKFNRFTLKYGYEFTTGSYTKTLEKTGSGWSHSNDFPRAIESQWLHNENDAILIADRLLRRFYAGMPRLNLTVPLSKVNADIGSLYAVNDDDMGYSSRIFEVVETSKDFSQKRTVTLGMWDGDTLYRQRGFAKFEDANSLTEAVSGTSTSGWGTNGTVSNINQSFYGSQFVWF